MPGLPPNEKLELGKGGESSGPCKQTDGTGAGSVVPGGGLKPIWYS